MTIQITGKTPIRMTFDDESVLEYEISDPVLKVMLSSSSVDLVELPSQDDSTLVDFAEVDWPDDLVVVENNERLTVEELHARLSNFTIHAIQKALTSMKASE